MSKIKYIFFLFAISLAFASKSSAQEWYMGVGGGYGFPVAGESITSYSPTSFTTQTLSFGKGLDIGLYGGYLFNKNIGAELDISYLDGASTDVTNYYSYTPVPFSNPNYANAVSSGSMVRLIPSLRFQYGEGKIRPYNVIGFIIGVGSNVTVKATDFNLSNETDTYNGGYSFGFHGALGARIMFSEKIQFFFEAAVNYQNFVPGKETFSGYSATVSFLRTGGNVSAAGNVYYSPAIYLPFSSVGVNAGLQFSFVKQAKAVVPAPK